MEDYLNNLNEQQREAVVYTDGPQLVIAGAGSGKTRVLTYKIVHLLAHGYEPWRILALTFTNKAAREMRERIKSVVGESVASKLWMGTFHSIFARILRTNAELIGFKSSFTIYDASDSKSLIKTIIKDLNLDNKIYKPAVVVAAISNAKNALVSPERYLSSPDIQDADRQARRPMIGEIYRIYCDRCHTAGAMDFDDLLYYTNVLLQNHPEVTRHYEEFFQYVLVDEYQDTNFAQHLIVSKLCATAKKLCAVGDDAQSIYSFRGANIRNILNLQNTYPELKIFKLEQNYRSTQNIVNAANSLIFKNRDQIQKNVFSLNDVGRRIDVIQSFSDYEEAYLVANRLSQLKMSQHDSYDEFAILYRTNAQSRLLEESLRKRNIPYRIYGGLSFYQRKEVKDAIAYFRLATNPNDDEALKRVINYPARGIGETTLNKLFRCAIDNGVSAWQIITQQSLYNPGFNAGTARKLNDFCTLISEFGVLASSGADAFTSASHIIKYSRILSSLLTENTPESIAKQENLNELLNGVKEFVTGKIEQGLEDTSLTDFLSEVSLATDQDTSSGDEPAVTLMTTHAAKGLEFNHVCIVGVEEDLFPSSMSNSSPESIEEERRLLYVAITRARTTCTIAYASSRCRNGQTCTCRPSRFIHDINPEYLHMASGNDIAASQSSHYRFGSTKRGSRSAFAAPPPPRFATVRTSTTASAPPDNQPNGGHSIHQLTELHQGMTISHYRFGLGIITDIDSDNQCITVKFSEVGTKKLFLKFARFNIIKS